MRTLLLIVVMALLAGCMPVVAPVSMAPAGPVETYYFLAANNADPFYIEGLAGFEAAAAELGVKTAFVGPLDLNLAAQIKAFEELIAKPNTGGIFWYAMDFNAGEPLVKQAQAAGIPVVIGAADSPFKTRAGFIGYDNTILGQQAADKAAAILGGQGVVGSIGVGGPGVTQRMRGYGAWFATSYPDITVIESQFHDGSAANATQVLDAYLIAHPDLDLLWWADGMSGQMVQPIRERIANGAKLKFLAMDMPAPTLAAVADGTYAATIGQDTYTEEYWGLKMLYAKRHGIRVPDTVYLAALILDASNVALFIK